MDDIEHDPVDGCGCDLCAAYESDLHTLADEHRDAWIAAADAVMAEEWPEGSALPYELGSTPANDAWDVGEAA